MSATTEINLEELTDWSTPRTVDTKRGPKVVRSGPLPPGFWDLWRGSKQALKDAGISCGKRNDEWQISWWQDIPKAEREHRETALDLSRAADASIDVPAPAGESYLPYQRGGIAFMNHLFDHGRTGALLGDEMGLGKTIQVIGVINNDPTIKSAVIVVPNFLKINWAKELRKWLVRDMTVGIASGKKWPTGCDIVVVNYDILKNFIKPDGCFYLGEGGTADDYKWALKNPGWGDPKPSDEVIVERGGKFYCGKRELFYEKDKEHGWVRKETFGFQIPVLNQAVDLAAIDEAHLCKNPKTARTKNTFGIKARRRIAATGTPIPNRVIEMFPFLNWLQPDEFGNFISFAKKYAGAFKGTHGWVFDGATNLPQLQAKLRSTVMVRRLKVEVLKELPAKRRQVILMPSTGELKAAQQAFEDAEKETDSLLDELRARMELAKVSDNEDDYQRELSAFNEAQTTAFAQLQEVAIDLALAKVPFIGAHIAEANTPFLLFTEHHDVSDAYAEKLKAAGKNIRVLDGRMSATARDRVKDEFQAGEYDGLICGMAATGVGLTLTRANLVAFGEINWVPGNMAQCEDRTHRIGQVNPVLVQLFVVEDSLDVRKAELLTQKMAVRDAALDKDQAEWDEPIERTDRVRVTMKEVKEQAVKITQEQMDAVHRALQMLAGLCDGAAKRDNVGFNGVDARIGNQLAHQLLLTPRQAVLGRKIAKKYHRQVGRDILEAAGCHFGEN